MDEMMSDTYVECLVKAKAPAVYKVLQVLCIALTVVFAISMLFISYIGLLLAVASGVGAYFAGLQASVEYEYLYLDRELSVDKVLAQTKRKRVATYSLNRMEVVAPFHSYHLDNYKNRQVKVRDFSIGQELKPDLRYAIYYEGGEKIIFSPSQEMVKALKNAAPRKVFTD
ncbi:MAG: DUF6106 family protein [Roseburia sp.]|nr:DUF6106 family protein [Roseburia sp.]